MATQTQIGNKNTNWQQKYNRATQIQHYNTNAKWQKKYQLAGGNRNKKSFGVKKDFYGETNFGWKNILDEKKLWPK